MYKIRTHKRYKAVSYIVTKNNDLKRMFRTLSEAVFYTTAMLHLEQKV